VIWRFSFENRAIFRSIGSAPVIRHEGRFGDRVHRQHVSHEGGRGFFVQIEMIDVQGMDGEHVAVGAVADGGAGAAESGFAEVGDALHRADGLFFRRVAEIGGEGGYRGGDVKNDPVPPSAPRRGVGIVDGHGEALGPFGGVAPVEFGRDVFPVAAEARKLLCFGQLSGKVVAAEGEFARIEG